jgi:hypothetical protein
MRGAAYSLEPVRHSTHYRHDEAAALLPWVAERLERMRSARTKLTDEETRDALTGAAPGNGGGPPGRAVSEAFLALRGALGELAARDIIVRDLDRGLVDFPSLRDGEEVYLCWVEAEEDALGFWHGLDDGYPGRQPL